MLTVAWRVSMKGSLMERSPRAQCLKVAGRSQWRHRRPPRSPLGQLLPFTTLTVHP